MTAYNSIVTIPGNLQHMCGDGVGNLYVLSTGATAANYTVYMYDISSDTLYDISDMSFPANPGCGMEAQLEWFSGTVYALIPVNATTMGVYAWAGATTWNLVDSAAMPAGTVVNSRNYIVADATRIAWSIWDPLSGFSVFRASTNGTAWADQTSPHSKVTKLHFDYDTDQLIGEDNDGANMSTVIHSSGNIWGALNAAVVDTKYHLVGTIHDYQFYADATLPTATQLRRSQDYCVNQVADGASMDMLTENMQIFYLLNTGVMVWPTSANSGRVYIWDVPTLAWVLDGVIGAAGAVVLGDPIRDNDTMYMLRADGASAGIYQRGSLFPAVAHKTYVPGSSAPRSMDVDADDVYLYIASLYATFPVLIRLQSDLLAAPTETYAPGAGTDIGVATGAMHSDWVWIVGDFGTPKVRVSIDHGITWATKDPGWAGVEGPFHLGPGNDDNMEIMLGSAAVQETLDGGLTWAQRSADAGIDALSMDRLDVHAAEVVIGASDAEAGTVRVAYTPNNFADVADVTGTVPVDSIVTDIIVG